MGQAYSNSNSHGVPAARRRRIASRVVRVVAEAHIGRRRGLISRDESSGEYQALYYDSRGVSRNYQMSFEGNTWKMWRDWPAFRQRFEATVSKDGRSIKGYWEKSVDGKPWERDFNMTFTRVS